MGRHSLLGGEEAYEISAYLVAAVGGRRELVSRLLDRLQDLGAVFSVERDAEIGVGKRIDILFGQPRLEKASIDESAESLRRELRQTELESEEQGRTISEQGRSDCGKGT